MRLAGAILLILGTLAILCDPHAGPFFGAFLNLIGFFVYFQGLKKAITEGITAELRKNLRDTRDQIIASQEKDA